MRAIAFCERERDLAPMTLFDDGTRIVAKRRTPEDRIIPTAQIGSFNDVWRHVKSGGRYIRHDDVLDLDSGEPSYDYSSLEDGRLWLRPVAEWREVTATGTRYEPITTDDQS